MPDLREIITNLVLLLSIGCVLSGIAGVWLLGRAKGRREGILEAQQLNTPDRSSILQQNERIDSLLLEVTRLRENQSAMSKVLRAAVQTSQPNQVR